MFGLTPHYSLTNEIVGLCLASMSAILFGAVYYSNSFMLPLWLKHSVRGTSKRSKGMIMTYAFFINLIQALTISKVIGIPGSFIEAMMRGMVVGLGMSAMALWHNSNFSRYSKVIPMIDGGYEIIKTGIMSCVLYAFHSPHIWTK